VRTSVKFYLLLFAVHALSILVHWAMWRWLGSIAPTFVSRHRKPILSAMVVLVLLPFGRELAFFWPEVSPLGIVGAVGAMWHLTVWMAMSAVGVFRLCERLGRNLLPAHSSERRQAIERIGGAMTFAASGTALGWGALRGRFDWTIEEVPIRLEKLPKALDGFTIVQLSDLHIGTFVGERELEAGLSLVERARPDLVVITGDIVDTDPRYVPLAARRLGALRAREGLVCIPGNHDYYTGAGAVLDGMRRAGIDVLLNRGRIIAEGDGGFALLGVDDLWARDNIGGQGPNLAAALSMVRPDLATVLLAHQPRYAAIASKAGIDLQLSGHTHGGQINPGFRPINWFFRYVAGRYDVGPTQLYVNRGFGTVGPPTRVGAPPEITKIVLVAG
jgi:predicted MPP superfamily phosphohydrolase